MLYSFSKRLYRKYFSKLLVYLNRISWKGKIVIEKMSPTNKHSLQSSEQDNEDLSKKKKRKIQVKTELAMDVW